MLLERPATMDELNGFALYDQAKKKHPQKAAASGRKKKPDSKDLQDMENWFIARCEEFESTLRRAARR